jgi:hypothetical protein
MAASTTVGGIRPFHRAARLGDNAFSDALALDWANGQVLSPSGSSVQSTAFYANTDCVVYISTTATIWITVGSNPTASTGAAGNMVILSTMPPTAIYVAAGLLVAAIGTASVSLIPALQGSG